MSEWSDTHTRVLRQHPRAVVHMRAQYRRRRLGLVLGAGVSKPVRIPNWHELVDRVAAHPRVQGKTVLRKARGRSSETSRVQMLFEHFRRKEIRRIQKEFGQEWCEGLLVENKVRERWREIVRDKLYETARIPRTSVRDGHPCLGAFIDVIRGQPMTVTYNFDDMVEQMLAQQNEQERKERKMGYETVWDISQPIRTDSPDDAIIYHPNGFLPETELERKSEWLVFSEDEYADQLIYSMTGYFSSLGHHLSKNTCLLIGLSLEDSTLRHLLRQQAKTNPGHYHYYVAHMGRRKALSEAERIAVTEANFRVYNLITLFLNDGEIKALGQAITCPPDDFLRNAQENDIEVKYCFYVTGAIAAGKSRLVAQFRSLDTQEEWPDIRRPVLGKRWKGLSSNQRKAADEWVADQFRTKNWQLWEAADRREGIHVIDRCPLDPLAFTHKDKWKDKGSLLLEKVCSGGAGRPVHPGHVILVIANPLVMASRVKAGQEEYCTEDLDEMQKSLEEIYYTDHGVTRLDGRDAPAWEYIKQASHVIHLEPYTPVDLHERLKAFANGDAQ